MEKTGSRARRRQLFAAVSVLGVSLGMADVTHTATDNAATTQSSHKGQASMKVHDQAGQRSIKGESQVSIKGESQVSIKGEDQTSIKGEGQTSMKYRADQHSAKLGDQISQKATTSQQLPPPGGQSSIKGEAQ